MTALVLGVFWTYAQSGLLELLGGQASNSYYNLLTQGLQEGQLSLKKEVPPGLAQLADPYDPAANRPYRYAPYVLHDLSYYQGKLYLYFGITPALVLFWPVAALTGHYLLHREAVAIFCTIGFLASLGLLGDLRRRYFPEVPSSVLAAAILALGLATSAPILLDPAEVYQVSLSCAYALTMTALGGIWLALHRPSERARWLAAASLGFGLAIGARPTALFGALVLSAPVLVGWKEPHRLRLLVAALVPAGLCCVSLALYNWRRFGNPFEFGEHYQIAYSRQDTIRHFSLGNLWFNFRLYFLAPVPWTESFPWIGQIRVPPLPPGHGTVEDPFGILTNTPVTWLALAAPWAVQGRSAGANPNLRLFLGILGGFFLLSCSPILLFYWSSSRYEIEFLPTLVLLAAVGIFALERALAGQPARRRAVRMGWGLFLGYSVVFNLLAGFGRNAADLSQYGNSLLNDGRVPAAIAEFRAALRIRPNYATAHIGLGQALVRSGRMPEAEAEFKTAGESPSTSADEHVTLGSTLLQLGRIADAVLQYKQALRLHPDSASAHFCLGYGLQVQGQLDEAIGQYREAVRLQPDSGVEHLGLALALRQAGQEAEAREQNQIAISLDPKLAGQMP